ncbi:MAG: sulfotransferase domain-containing protein [Micropepsaceae bacterium]
MDSRRWEGYRSRPGDVIVCTFPKCGTTWAQQIVSLLIFQSPEPRPVTAIAPWIDFRSPIPVDTLYATLEAQAHRRSLKSHLPFDALPFRDDVRYIHVARDGLDAFMSWHNHTLRYQRTHILDETGKNDETIARVYPRAAVEPRAFFREWMGLEPDREPDFSAEAFFDTERTWWEARNRPNVLMVHYNDLKADLDREMRRVAEFLGVHTPDSVWPSLVQSATFEAMKRDGGKLMPAADASFQGGHEGFIFQGRNERWRQVLSEDDVELFRGRAASAFDPELQGWLATGCVAGDPTKI